MKSLAGCVPWSDGTACGWLQEAENKEAEDKEAEEEKVREP